MSTLNSLLQDFAISKNNLTCRMIFSLAGTGVCCQRLRVIAEKDSYGLTASEVAEQNGHKEIADLLRGEQMRMEFFE